MKLHGKKFDRRICVSVCVTGSLAAELSQILHGLKIIGKASQWSAGLGLGNTSCGPGEL
jgi:hypothetical protein